MRSGARDYVPGHGDESWSALHYALDIDYRPQGNRLSGDATITARAKRDLDSLELDLHHLRAAKVTVEGEAVRFSHRDGRLRLRTSAGDGEEFTITVKYAGSPRPLRMRHLGTAGWEELADGAIVAAQPHGAPTWFPCNDRPGDKATYEIALTVPREYAVGLSGPPPRIAASGASRTHRTEMDRPMATYLATAQVGRYEWIDLGSGIHVLAPPGVRGEAFDASLGRQPEMMAAFVERFGPYPFDSYTAVVTADDLEIPLESQALSTFGRNFVSGQWQHERLVAHELAHQWFGNAVTLNHWRDIWLHEGFACYAEWLWSEASGRRTAGEWAEHHHDRLAGLDQDLLLADPGPELMFDDRVYKRGALTLHALRAEVGDEDFFEALATWVAQNEGENVTGDDFEDHCEEVTGADLDGLFDAWLRETDLPALTN